MFLMVSFSMIPGNKCIFLMLPGNKCCHGNTCFLFLGLMNLFMGSLHSIPLYGLELISFGEYLAISVPMATLFCSLDL